MKANFTIDISGKDSQQTVSFTIDLIKWYSITCAGNVYTCTGVNVANPAIAFDLLTRIYKCGDRIRGMPRWRSVGDKNACNLMIRMICK